MSVHVSQPRRSLAARFERIKRHDAPSPRGVPWEAARDSETGALVRVLPRPSRLAWPLFINLEYLTREIAARELPWIVPVLHVGPGIARAESPPSTPHPRLRREVAAACTLAACEVVAHLHALGAGTQTVITNFSSLDLCVDGARASIAWHIPGRGFDPAQPDAAAESFEDHHLPPIAADLRRLGRLFFKLCPEPHSEPLTSQPQRAALEALAALCAGELSSRTCTTAAGLARLLGQFAPADRVARIAALPVVDALPPLRLDLDAVIADGEAELSPDSSPRSHRPELDDGPGDFADQIAVNWNIVHRSDEQYVAVPLATAYHQRACASFARGDLGVALADVQRARELDDFPPYRTTLAAVLDASNRGSEARAVIAAALADWSSPEAWDVPPEEERGRAHAMRGAFALRDGDLELAESELRRAFELHPTAAYAHHLGAVLYARDDLEAAREVESRAVELQSDDPRYRWALAVTLHDLGRVNEAFVHARAAVSRDAAYRERMLRRFGRP